MLIDAHFPHLQLHYVGAEGEEYLESVSCFRLTKEKCRDDCLNRSHVYCFLWPDGRFHIIAFDLEIPYAGNKLLENKVLI